MKKTVLILGLLAMILDVSSVQAGGALIININGSPVSWDANNSDKKITVHPEAGSCGQFNNSQMATRLTNNLQQWSDITTVDLGFTIQSGTVPSVNGNNYTSFLAGVSGNTSQQNTDNVQDGINPILYDDDGEIIDSATGQNNGRFTILGFANPAGFSVDSSNTSLFTNIVDGQAVFNCYCLDDGNGNPANNDCTSTFSVDDLDFTMVHELGHMINLDHTQVNSSLINDGDTSNDNNIPSMFPVSVSASNQITPMEDDIVTLSSLYPSSTFFSQGSTSSTYCQVTGTLLDSSSNAMRCVDLQFQSDDTAFNVAFVSGAYAAASDGNSDNDTADDGECTSGCGGFTIYLRPGRTYALVASAINSSFVGGSGISPCANGQLAACTGNSSTTSGCAANETLTVNSAGETISTKIATECTAGAVVALGNIGSNSISGDSGGSSTGGSTGGSGSTSSSTTAACSLNTANVKEGSGLLGLFVLLGLGALIVRQKTVSLDR